MPNSLRSFGLFHFCRRRGLTQNLTGAALHGNLSLFTHERRPGRPVSTDSSRRRLIHGRLPSGVERPKDERLLTAAQCVFHLKSLLDSATVGICGDTYDLGSPVSTDPLSGQGHSATQRAAALHGATIYDVIARNGRGNYATIWRS